MNRRTNGRAPHRRTLWALFAAPFLLAPGIASAQEIRPVPAERVSPALYCGNAEVTLYTGNAGNPATEFRAGDFNPDQNGQRYFIDPDVGGTIEAVWYEPVDNLAALGEFRRIAASPSPNNDRVFILELLAEPDAEPARLTITLHFACRPGAG
jgi:hypothetical protein